MASETSGILPGGCTHPSPDAPLAASGAGRTLLVLTYRWPPQGGVSVQRVTKFVKYLARKGWRPVVHTVSNPYAPVRDQGLERDVPPGVPVYRTPTVEWEAVESSLASVVRRLRGAQDGETGKENGRDAAIALEREAETGTVGRTEREARAKRHGQLGALGNFVWSRVLVPDPQIVWAGAAYLRSLAIARRERPAAIFSTSPPNSINVLAAALARRLDLPWIADLRDPWTEGIRRKQWYPGNPGRKKREERWEREIFERARAVVVTTEATRADFLRKYPSCPPDKIVVITNGFDPEDFAHVTEEPRFLEPGLLHVTVTGTVETLFDLVPFLTAVRDLVRDDADARRLLRVNFVGTKRQPLYDELIAREGLGDVVRFFPFMPHADSVQYVADSQVLMLCQVPREDSGAIKIQGKMCEYLYTRKPILALTIPGETATVLERAGVGRIVDPRDVAALRRALEQLLAEFCAGGLIVRPDAATIDEFDRAKQAEKLDRLLTEAIAGS
ncbi:MAG: glycosyltransferase family 4 protein [Thermodesulfobacteriota bacterium]